jgi:hypothetical protein
MKPRQLARIKAGKAARLKAEISCSVSGEPLPDIPLFSHDATIQSFFNRGWNSVSQVDVRIELSKQQQSTINVGLAARANISNMLGRKALSNGGAHELV